MAYKHWTQTAKGKRILAERAKAKKAAPTEKLAASADSPRINTKTKIDLLIDALDEAGAKRLLRSILFPK